LTRAFGTDQLVTRGFRRASQQESLTRAFGTDQLVTRGFRRASQQESLTRAFGTDQFATQSPGTSGILFASHV
jgi:hypothetical protein